MRDSPKMSEDRLVYICDWLPPDFGAVGQYSVLFAREFAQNGCDVTLVGLTSSEASCTVENFGSGSLRIVKVHARQYTKTNTLHRISWTITTNTRLLFTALRYMKHSQSILFTGSPPLLIHWIAPLNILLGKKLIYRITDFHPECSIAERGRAGLFLSFVRALTLFWRRRIDRFEVLGRDQALRLREIDIPEDRIVLKRDPSPVAITPDTPALARPIAAEGKFLLLYSGNWGVAHDVETFLQAYIEHHRNGSGTVLLWLNATGNSASQVADKLKAAHVPHIRSGLVPLDQLASLLRTPDAHLITLKTAFVGYVLPSKVYACIESGLPVIFVGPTGSDVHTLCRERSSGSYFHVAIGDVVECVRLLEDLGARRRATSTERVTLARSSV